MIERGNIDLSRQPIVQNPDGTTSTVDSVSFRVDGVETLIPRVTEDGRHLSDTEALDHYHRTGRHLGKFKTSKAATAYAKRLHEEYEKGHIKQTTPVTSIPGTSRTGLPSVPWPPIPEGLRPNRIGIREMQR